MDTFRADFAALPTTPRDARVWLRARLHAWQLDPLAPTAELLLTELVANVVQHVGRPMRVELTCRDGRLHVEVEDPAPAPPVVQIPDDVSEGGRGLFLVASLADRWGTEREPGTPGKRVWFELGTPTHQSES